MKVHWLLFVLLILSCQKQAKDTTITSVNQPTEIKNNEKEKPSKKNLEDFLYDYGELNTENQVVIETNFGQIDLELFDEVYLHRANFIYLIKSGYYDNMAFHRVIKDFMIQGGKNKSYETTKRRADIGYYDIPAEINAGYKHSRGMLSAAREWDNNPEKRSSAFEFFIIQRPNGAPHLNGEHTVFGRVSSGMDVVDAISKVKTGENDWPIEPVIIKKISIK